MTDPMIFSVDVKNNQAMLNITPSGTYVFDIQNVQRMLPRAVPGYYAYSMMSAAEYLVRCARQLIPQSSENLEIFDSILKDLDRLDIDRSIRDSRILIFKYVLQLMNPEEDIITSEEYDNIFPHYRNFK